MSVDAQNREKLDPDQLKRVLRHSGNPYARACAWVLLDRLLEEPDLEDLEKELRSLRDRRESS